MKWQPLTATATQAVVGAKKEARALWAHSCATEHLLLGLVGDGVDSVAVFVLAQLSIAPVILRSEVRRQAVRGETEPPHLVPLAADAKRAIDLAYEAARELHNDYFGTEHLLLGLLAEETGLAGRVLHQCGVDRERVWDEVRRLQAGDGAQGKNE